MILLAARSLLIPTNGKGWVTRRYDKLPKDQEKPDTYEFEDYGCKCHQNRPDGPAGRNHGLAPTGDERTEGSAEFVPIGLERVEFVVEACADRRSLKVC